MKNDEKTIHELIDEAQANISQGNLQKAIDCLTQTLSNDLSLSTDYWEKVLWPLGNLYGATKQYDKAIPILELELKTVLDFYHVTDNGYATIPKEISSKLVSICLNLGTAYQAQDKVQEAKDAFAMGYVISFNSFGEYDYQTLKQAWNIAAIELLNGDQIEGIRQMQYCYYDVREHLGKDNDLLQHIEHVLVECKIDPNEIYDSYINSRDVASSALEELVRYASR